jgi:hypothetical protein
MIKQSITYGILTGIIMTVYFVLLYAGGIDMLSNFWLFLLSFPMLIFFIFFFAVKVKRQYPGEPFTYGQAFTTMFLIGATASVVSLVYNILLFNVIDTDLGARLSDRIIDNTATFMESVGTPEKDIEKALADMSEMEEGFTATGQLVGWLKGLVFYVIVAAIGALIIKRKQAPATLDVA